MKHLLKHLANINKIDDKVYTSVILLMTLVKKSLVAIVTVAMVYMMELKHVHRSQLDFKTVAPILKLWLYVNKFEINLSRCIGSTVIKKLLMGLPRRQQDPD